jgi:hypothetical protein
MLYTFGGNVCFVVGLAVVAFVGFNVGTFVGFRVGALVGFAVGLAVGYGGHETLRKISTPSTHLSLITYGELCAGTTTESFAAENE